MEKAISFFEFCFHLLIQETFNFTIILVITCAHLGSPVSHKLVLPVWWNEADGVLGLKLA